MKEFLNAAAGRGETLLLARTKSGADLSATSPVIFRRASPMARFLQSLSLALTTTRIGRCLLHVACLVRELVTRRPVRWPFHRDGIRREFQRKNSSATEDSEDFEKDGARPLDPPDARPGFEENSGRLDLDASRL